MQLCAKKISTTGKWETTDGHDDLELREHFEKIALLKTKLEYLGIPSTMVPEPAFLAVVFFCRIASIIY